jgi:DNA-binding transcriptional regulator YiaG
MRSGSPRETGVSPDDFRALRQRLGLTQRSLAEALGVTERSVRRCEAGTQKITPTIAKLLATLATAAAQPDTD